MSEVTLPDGRIFAAGEWITGRGAEITSVFPADGTTNRVLRGASAEDLDRAIDGAVTATQALKVGHPMEPGTQVAPLIRAPHRTAVEAHVAAARADGGEVLAGGARPAGLEAGTYYLPTIIAGLGNEARLCREEVFGPVLARCRSMMRRR